jgi:uncharacterized repeat protein (TIGR04076 family)
VAAVKAEVVTVRGTCNAGLEKGDSFLVGGLRVEAQGNNKPCSVAFATLVMNGGCLRLHDSPIYVCCPDPGTGEGGNVTFKLSFARGDEDDQG